MFGIKHELLFPAKKYNCLLTLTKRFKRRRVRFSNGKIDGG